jgi:hypothetical protein
MVAKKKAPPAKPAKKTFDEAVEVEETGIVVAGDDSASVSTMTSYSAVPQLDASDLYIPKLRIGQGLSAEVANGDAKLGDWLLTGQSPMKTCTVVPLLMTRRRELRDRDERGVICRSADSVHGVGAPGGDCSTCPMNQWTPNKKTGKNQAPPCIFIYSYMVYVVEANELAVLEFYRTSMAAGKLLNTIILQKGLGNFAIKLGSTKTEGPKGTFASPSLVIAKVEPKVLSAAKTRVSEMGFGG